MKTKTIVLSLLLCFFTVTVCFAKDAWIGTWKLTKSKYSGPLNSHVVMDSKGQMQLAVDAPQVPVETAFEYAYAGGDNVKITVDGILINGQVSPAHYEWTGKFDSEDYPVTGDPNSDTWSYQKVNDSTFALTMKKGGKVIPNGQVVVSFHGKTCKVTKGGTTSEYHRN